MNKGSEKHLFFERLDRKHQSLYNKKFTEMIRKSKVDRATDITDPEMESADLKIKNHQLLKKVLHGGYDETFDAMIKEIVARQQHKSVPREDENFAKTKYASHGSLREFFDKYQKFKETERKGTNEIITPSLAFIKGCNEEMIIPNPSGLIKRKGDDYKLSLKNQKVGDPYIEVLSKSLQYADHVREIYLSSNRLSGEGASPLLTTITDNKRLLTGLKVLDLASNKLGDGGVEKLIIYIQEEDCRLEHLNVEDNQLGDRNITWLAETIALTLTDKIYSLNLGKNGISDISANAIGNLISACDFLKVLYLHWNNLKNPGATLIMAKLRKNTEIRIFDISWNCIGNSLTQEPVFEEVQKWNMKTRNFHNFEINESLKSMVLTVRKSLISLPLIISKKKAKKKDDQAKKEKALALLAVPKITIPPKPVSSFAKELGEYFKLNCGLVHLDISHNNLPQEDGAYLSQEVKNNHTVLGMHLDGNEMMIDGLGFIYPTKKNCKEPDYFSKSQIYYELGKDSNLTKTRVDPVRKIRAKNNCWICGGWREVDFELRPGKKFGNLNAHIAKIHLGFENWKPYDMFFSVNKYKITRMCPPGSVYYFFTLDMIPESNYGADQIKLNSTSIFKFKFDKDYMDEFNNVQLMNSYMGNEIPTVTKEEQQQLEIQTLITIHTLGRKHVAYNSKVLNDEYRKALRYCEPRPVKIINRFVKPQTPWNFSTSIWAYYNYEYDGYTEGQLDAAFEHDFKRSAFNEKDVTEDEQYLQLRGLLRSYYRDILDCYKSLSSYSGCALRQISQNTLIDWVNKCPNLCDKKYDVNNVLLKVTEICTNVIDLEEKKKPVRLVCDNLVRHQFLALFVKVPKDKYIRTNAMPTVIEAINYSFDNHFLPAIRGFDSHKWRKDRYYNEAVDNFLRAHLPIFDALYNSFAKQKGPKKTDVWMEEYEFNNCVNSFVDKDEFPTRENTFIFNCSMKLQTSEILSDKHLKMFFDEFLEGICRAVDKASPRPQEDSPDEWPMNKRNEQTLVSKLENVIALFVKLISHPDFKLMKEKFPMPTKNVETGLYEIDYENNPFYQGYMLKTKEGKLKIVFDEF